jgi:predicted phage tail component-like protein
MFPSFIYNSKDSYEDFGIIINKLPPSVVPENNIDEYELPGRDGNLTIDYKTRKSYILPLECTIMDESRIEEVKAWLMNTSSDLIFSWDPDYKYQARIINKIDISQSLKTFGEFPLMFKVQPYKLSIGEELITLTNTGTIYNGTGNTSLPIIKIFGTGAITLTINSKVVTLTNIVDYVTLDSDLMDAYKGTQLLNNQMNGEFSQLIPGNNPISFTGSVTSIEITPNFRYI